MTRQGISLALSEIVVCLRGLRDSSVCPVREKWPKGVTVNIHTDWGPINNGGVEWGGWWCWSGREKRSEAEREEVLACLRIQLKSLILCDSIYRFQMEDAEASGTEWTDTVCHQIELKTLWYRTSLSHRNNSFLTIKQTKALNLNLRFLLCAFYAFFVKNIAVCLNHQCPQAAYMHEWWNVELC